VLPGDQLLARQVGGSGPEPSHQSVDQLLPAHPPHQTPEADVDVGNPELAACPQEVQVVDPLHLGVVGVDDLAVEDVLGERDLAGVELERAERLRAAPQPQRAGIPFLHVGPFDPPDLAARPLSNAKGGHARIRAGGIGEEIDDGAELLA